MQGQKTRLHRDQNFVTTCVDTAAFIESQGIEHLQIAPGENGKKLFIFPPQAEDVAPKYAVSESARFAIARRRLLYLLHRV